MKFMNISKIKVFVSLLLFCLTKTPAQNIEGLNDFNKTDIIYKKDTVTILHSNIKINANPKPTILFLQGSLPTPLILEKDGVKKVSVPFDYSKLIDSVNVVIINRKGVLLSSKFDSLKSIQSNPTKEFTKHNNLFYRTEQAKIVLDYLHKQKWVDKSKIFVVGHSEGYRVAAYLSKFSGKKISKLVCMSADPFNRTSEEVTKLELDNISNPKDSLNCTIISDLVKNYKSINKISEYIDDYDLYNWASYEANMPINYFEKFKNPLLIVYGTNDPKSFNNHLIPFLIKKENIMIKAYPDMDHNFFIKEYDTNNNLIQESYQWDFVFKDVVNWLLKK